jgi:plastocyanin
MIPLTRTLLICFACALAVPASSYSEPGAQKRKSAPNTKKIVPDPPAQPAGNHVDKSPGKASPSGVAAAIEGSVKLPDLKSAPVKIQRYQVVSKGGAVAMSPSMAVVYLEGQFPKPSSFPKVQMIQKDLTFIPALLPVQAGTTVEFPNQDDTYHNVFSFSKAKRFDLGRFLPNEQPVPSQLFDKPGLIQLHCDIHEHMWAVILVLETPYFTTTDATGHFKLPGLPPGKFTLKAWLNSAQTVELPVELKGGTTLKADFQ